jgi:RNA 2',3'-cyclic 3'-phosphodiesterase
VTDEHVRLFVALELPDQIREGLIGWRQGVLQDLRGVRAVAPEALHVTLCFLGWRLGSEIEAIAAACQPVSSRPRPRLSLSVALWLPARRPRVLAVEVHDTDGALAETQGVLSRELQAGGWYLPELRPFMAHVTVGRVARGVRVGAVELPPPPELSFEASTVTLFLSRLGAGGARYEPLTRVLLGSADAPLDPMSVVQRFHAAQARAYASGELDGVRELLDEDVVWRVPGRSAIAGEHRGVDAVLDYLQRRAAMTDATFRVTVRGLSVIGEQVVQLAGGRAERAGRTLTWETVGIFRVRAGRIAECRLVPFDLYEFDEIWS